MIVNNIQNRSPEIFPAICPTHLTNLTFLSTSSFLHQFSLGFTIQRITVFVTLSPSRRASSRGWSAATDSTPDTTVFSILTSTGVELVTLDMA